MRIAGELRINIQTHPNQKKGNSVKREDLRIYETTDDEGNTEEKVIRKVKQHYRNKDCIVGLRNHVIRKRAGSGKSDVWMRHNELEGIWDDFKPDVTEAEKKKMTIKLLKDETREMRRKC